ncbi:DUF4129 domain-containing protein [Actinokineospora inagensis]|uniref:DUF4129 domain-containing protein n=1 Tax=Actinokineospora inagensis TaxID=103730 RepID=UPI0003FC0E09|nr:DUF4129 domain-containing protein [Actinokineospora inagensis]
MSPRLSTLPVAAALLLLAAAAARGTSAIPAGPATAAPSTARDEVVSSATPAPTANPFLDFVGGIGTGLLLLAVATMLLIGLTGFLMGFTRRRRVRPVLPDLQLPPHSAPPDGTATATALATAAHNARLRLTAAPAVPTADAIIAAWLELEQTAATLGTPRAPHQTPTEFATALLTAHQADEPALTTLRHAYHRARFAHTPTFTPADLTKVTSALTTLEHSLTTPR